MKKPFPWYSDTRSGGGWFVKLSGDQKFLATAATATATTPAASAGLTPGWASDLDWASAASA